MTRRLRIVVILGAGLLAALPLLAGDSENRGLSRMEREVRREIVTLPFYSLFDHFAFRVDGDTVTLTGKVSRPTLKSDAENVVKKIEGVARVNNEIQVLPLSPNDNRLRLALYQAIYGHSALETLAVRAVPPIHIIVENGNVTLEGVVANELQRTVAGAQAASVPGAFSVTNNLVLEDRT